MVFFSLMASNKCSTMSKKAIIISWSYKLPQQHLCDVFLTTLFISDLIAHNSKTSSVTPILFSMSIFKFLKKFNKNQSYLKFPFQKNPYL